MARTTLTIHPTIEACCRVRQGSSKRQRSHGKSASRSTRSGTGRPERSGRPVPDRVDRDADFPCERCRLLEPCRTRQQASIVGWMVNVVLAIREDDQRNLRVLGGKRLEPLQALDHGAVERRVAL